MKKKSQVVMLATNEKANIGDIILCNNPAIERVNWKGKLGMCNIKNGDGEWKTQHLYILSDEKIKEGDWCLNLDTNDIFKLGKYGVNNAKKIIATTDTSLGLPLIPESFIKYYISEYNKGNIITDVEVEYEDNGEEGWIGDDYNGEPFWNEKLELKVNPDNTINIYPIKNSWNREEFEIAIRETWRVACSDTYEALSPELEDEWVNEILK